MDGTSFVEHRSAGVRPLESLPACPVETCVQLMGNKWRPLIIRDLLTGPKRFGELQRSVDGVSQKVLTQNLRDMEDSGLVLRCVYPEVPPHVEYALTELGESLGPVIATMRAWGTRYQELARELDA